jgi:hypothetical protein
MRPGIAAAQGTDFARLVLGTVGSCAGGGGALPSNAGPFTRWGCYSPASTSFPVGGYDTTLSIYLDTAYAASHFDQRFDFTSAVNDNAGNHRRDFVFNAGTVATGFLISASTNAGRCGAYPNGTPVITQSGWYAFNHAFRDVCGVLQVTLTIVRQSDAQVVGTFVLSDPSDLIALIGGDGGAAT